MLLLKSERESNVTPLTTGSVLTLVAAAFTASTRVPLRETSVAALALVAGPHVIMADEAWRVLPRKRRVKNL